MRWLLALASILLLAIVNASLGRNATAVSHDLYITVGKGADGQDGPVSGASVTIRFSGGGEQTKKTDDEGVAKFTVENPGRYYVTVKKDGYQDFQGQRYVDPQEKVTYASVIELKLGQVLPGKVRLVVTLKDDSDGWPIPAADIETKRDGGGTQVSDHTSTDQDGKAYVLFVQRADLRNGLNAIVTASAKGYETASKTVTTKDGDNKDYPVEIRLKRQANQQVIAITAVEEGTRAPILNAFVKLDGGLDGIFTAYTEGDGRAVFHVPGGKIYSLTISTKQFDEVTDKIDLVGQKTATTVERTYDLSKNDKARKIFRPLIVFVKYKAKDGTTKPVQNATIAANAGRYSPVTDAQGIGIIVHNRPPGEIIKVTASGALYDPVSSEVMVRDKGVMLDYDQWERDSTRMGSQWEALKKQNITGYDSVTIMLKQNDVELVKQVKGSIECDDEVDPGDNLPYTVKLTYADGDTDVVTIEETIVITDSGGRIVKRAGNIRALNKTEPSTADYAFTPEKPGRYNIRCTVKWDGGVLWTGEKAITAKEDRRKATITGNVVPKKGLVKMDEAVRVAVNVLYESGPTTDLTVSETVELFDPKGAVVQNNFSHRSLKVAAYSERSFNITCQAPGVYRLKSTIKSDSGEVLWTGEGTFEVDKVGKSVMTKPGSGYYRLKSKVLGHAPPPAQGPVGTVSGSITESQFQCLYEGINGNDIHCSVTLQFSVPPTVIKPNDTIELTVSANAAVEGKDAPAGFGASGGWSANGSGSVVEGRSVYGGRASDGKMYSSNSGKFKIAVGKGGSLTIYNGHIGALWGSSDNWTPCAYVYEWVENAAPPSGDGNGKTTMTGGAEDSRPGDPSAYRSSSVQFGSFGTCSLEIKLGRDFTGNGKSKDGRSIIALWGSYNPTSGKLSGSGLVNRGGTKYTITVSGTKRGNEIVGEMSVKAGKGSVKSPFTLRKG